jgi:hypothetical protein
VVRKMLAVAALMLAIAVPGVGAAASPAAAAATPESMSATTSTTWQEAGTYPTYDECDVAGADGQAAGQWISYYCEYNGYDYTLWVEVNITPPPRCATPGHAYVVRGGQLYWSGYEGDERNGVPTLSLPRGSYVTVGGNGIMPDQEVHFYVFDDSGTQQFLGKSSKAGGNCVANERGVIITLQPGHYLVKAFYQSGNTGIKYFDRVTYLQVW